jgi:dTDP-4-dehydrorhamnose 3,5-epimerase
MKDPKESPSDARDIPGIDPEFAPRLTVQSYQARPRIEGVTFHDLKRFVDDGGSFLEMARLSAGEMKARPGPEIRQINYAVLEPGTIKAFHLHFRQSEFWFVPPESRLLMGLVDVRRGSPTCRVSMRFVLGEGQPRLLFIPAGVAHGAANLTDRLAQVFYLTDQEFDPDPSRCDERRLPWDVMGASFWEREKG